ncbi:binding-protein-dependent transport systems inner membrane component [Paenibacillus vortex V453]|uniref:Binding-protein-dependent transport systems inner membrane component n=1 Tax=Paenibacillus vortex V453 TaxID=715225 RepID=A0A2R9SXT4_9BACL|nr:MULTISPECIES: sugar ABC transporter permease [Paenibacillus]EFU42185.1 binding-protein-dependent transport systems inner membrane component [Paenibacillus vortex V453]MDH6672655.1 multiple sugar transport system permease protein [Paenibacillus sp. LBL]
MSSKTDRKNLRNGLLFISPWIIGFLLFTAYPLFSSLYYSLTDYNIINEPVWVGLDNYVKLFTGDSLFYKVLYNTLFMIVVGISVTTVGSVFIAILLNNRRIRGLAFFRVVFFLPTLVPLVVLSILWIWVLQPDNGVLNTILGFIGIEGPGWFSSPFWAKPAFVLMALWGSGQMIIIYLAGLQGISDSLYEAASIDGASSWRQVFHITIPMLKPAIVFNVITGMIGTLQSFAESFIITNGGPDGSTMFYSLYLYQNAFQYAKMGYASAMAWILLVIALLITLFLFKLSNGFKAEE